MNELYFINDEIPAHKKKSKKKGLSRANHKHIYETVLLIRHLHFHHGDSEYMIPTKVCMICGRIGKTDEDEILWEKSPDTSIPKWAIWGKELSKKALDLPKWEVEGFGKFATRMELNK